MGPARLQRGHELAGVRRLAVSALNHPTPVPQARPSRALPDLATFHTASLEVKTPQSKILQVGLSRKSYGHSPVKPLDLGILPQKIRFCFSQIPEHLEP